MHADDSHPKHAIPNPELAALDDLEIHMDLAARALRAARPRVFPHSPYSVSLDGDDADIVAADIFELLYFLSLDIDKYRASLRQR